MKKPCCDNTFIATHNGHLDCLKYAHETWHECKHNVCISMLKIRNKSIEKCHLCKTMIEPNIGRKCSHCDIFFHQDCLFTILDSRFKCPSCKKHML